MKKTVLFKNLVDILYILHFIGLIGILFILPFANININEVDIQDWNLFHWLIILLSLITYIIFLRGLYFLRRIAKFLLLNHYFSENVIEHLKKSGNYFLLTGILSFVILLGLGISKLSINKLYLVYNSDIIIPLFLTIIGLFFIIQSHTLRLAKEFKEENELTI